MTRRRHVPVALLAVAAAPAAAGFAALADEPAKKKAEASGAAAPKVDPKDLEHARTTVKMLDDVYKTAVVLITDKYVNKEEDFPAGAVAVAWFEQINKKGWHTVRLIDATGDPYDPENVAKSDFEKRAIERLKKGEGYIEQIAGEEGKPVLLAATPIPVVLEKCVMCHPHYKDVPKGEPIGALTYEIPIR